MKKIVEKWVIHKFGRTCYFLGRDKFGKNHFLQSANFECGWYWGGGYVETYTNNQNPEQAKDIQTHTHFDSLFFNNPLKNAFRSFKEYFPETPFSDSEIWKICELMKTFYIARDYADIVYRGGARYASNPASDVVKNEAEYKRINGKVIPEIMNELYKILGDKEEDKEA